ncbi:hypothetical protein AT1219_50056 [Vibrio alginolyticus]
MFNLVIFVKGTARRRLKSLAFQAVIAIMKALKNALQGLVYAHSYLGYLWHIYGRRSDSSAPIRT